MTDGRPQSQPVVLRPYQTESVTRVREAYASGAKSVVHVAPTGSGKTVVFSHILSGAMRRGRRVLILSHRAGILDQIEAALRLAGVGTAVADAFEDFDWIVNRAFRALKKAFSQ